MTCQAELAAVPVDRSSLRPQRSLRRNRTDQSDRTDRSDLMRPSAGAFSSSEYRWRDSGERPFVHEASAASASSGSLLRGRRARLRLAGIRVFDEPICQDRYRAAVAEADRLDPGWREGTSPASSEMIPDDGNSAVLVMASYEKIPRGWQALKGEWPPLSLDPRTPLAPKLLTDLKLRHDEARDGLADGELRRPAARSVSRLAGRSAAVGADVAATSPYGV